MKVKLLEDQTGVVHDAFGRAERNEDGTIKQKLHKAGDEIDHPDAHYLIRAGIAEPIDDEARQTHADFLEKQAQKAKAHAERLIKNKPKLTKAQEKQQDAVAKKAKEAELK